MKYHGEVFDPEGRTFIEIEGDCLDAPICSLEITRDRMILDIALDPSEARELARHLIEAANTSEMPQPCASCGHGGLPRRLRRTNPDAPPNVAPTYVCADCEPKAA
jgi:hypothetical protein